MKILIISPYLPHPLSGHGGGTYLYGVVSHLSKSHEVSLISFADNRERELSDSLKNLPIGIHLVPREKGKQKNTFTNACLAARRTYQLLRSIVLWEPYYVSKFRHREMARVVAHLTEERLFDVVQIEFVQMGGYVKYVRGGKTILHDHDVAIRYAYRQYKKASFFSRRMIMFVEWRRWFSYYSRFLKRFDRVVTITEQDRMLLQRLTGMSRTSYLPAGVDIPQEIPRYETREKHSLLFVGSFSLLPNVDAAMWLCEEIFPMVKLRFPEVILYIIGSNPASNLQELARQQGGVEILGFVEDIVSYLQRCAVFVAPLRLGGGVKIKLLHAMASGIPVVTTKIGAEGIEGIGHDNMLIANTAQGLAEAVCRLFQDRMLASAVGRKGRETMAKNYSWESVTSRLEDIYRKVLEST